MGLTPITLPATIRIGEDAEIEIELDIYAYRDEDGDLVVNAVTLTNNGTTLDLPERELNLLIDEIKELF